MLSKLPPRERQIVDILYERGPVAVADICEALPDPLSGSAVRAMLKRLEDKGFVQRTDSDRGYLYSPVVSEMAAKKSALSEIVRVFFDGAPDSAAAALLGMADKLEGDQLDELEAMIARARRATGGK
jgi:predicted transcriptional regulator